MPGNGSVDAAGYFRCLRVHLGRGEFRVMIMQEVLPDDGQFPMFVDAPAKPGVEFKVTADGKSSESTGTQGKLSTYRSVVSNVTPCGKSMDERMEN